MNLFTETKQFAVWFARLNKVCLTTRPFWTTFVIGATVVSNVAKLLAFLLPLKVVLLAGSEGVPRYFAFFIDVESKDFWIVGLAAGAIISYVTHLALDNLVQRMALTGGNSVTRMANKLALVGNQERTAQKYYSRITGLTADVVFLLMALGLITLLLPQMMAMLGIASTALLFLTAGWLALGDERRPTWPESNAKLYSSIITSSLFLIGFLLIVLPYIQGGGPNIMASLISIVLLKRVAKTLHSIFTGGVSLFGEQSKIDALMSRKGKLVEKEVTTKSALRELFQKHQRQSMIRMHLPDQYKDCSLDARWEDQRLRYFDSLKIIVKSGRDDYRENFRLHIFDQKYLHFLGKELQLFEYIERDKLLSPVPIKRFNVEDFTCVLFNYESGERYPSNSWRKEGLGTLKRLWSVEPPKKLVKDYKLSHKLISNRIDSQLIERARVAAESGSEEKMLNHFIDSLQSIREKISGMPLYIENGDLTPKNIVRPKIENSHEKILFWGNWSIEPVGYTLPRLAGEDELHDCVEYMRESGRSFPDQYTVHDMLWTNLVARIEVNINKNQYRSAIKDIVKFYKVYMVIE